jgi:hypothetical protein
LKDPRTPLLTVWFTFNFRSNSCQCRASERRYSPQPELRRVLLPRVGFVFACLLPLPSLVSSWCHKPEVHSSILHSVLGIHRTPHNLTHCNASNFPPLFLRVAFRRRTRKMCVCVSASMCVSGIVLLSPIVCGRFFVDIIIPQWLGRLGSTFWLQRFTKSTILP